MLDCLGFKQTLYVRKAKQKHHTFWYLILLKNLQLIPYNILQQYFTFWAQKNAKYNIVYINLSLQKTVRRINYIFNDIVNVENKV